MTRRLVVLTACTIAWPAAHAADDSLRNLEALSVDIVGEVRWRL